MPHAAMQRLSPEMQECIDHCQECQEICLEAVDHGLRQGGPHAEAGHIRLLLDCAEICRTSAGFMLRGSELHGRTCAVCAEICERCARDCEGFEDDDLLKQCAEICARCAESCRRMSNGTGGGGGT